MCLEVNVSCMNMLDYWMIKTRNVKLHITPLEQHKAHVSKVKSETQKEKDEEPKFRQY